MNPRRAAQERLERLDPGRYEARVLVPSPPAVTGPPWAADDPVDPAGAEAGRVVVSPVRNADRTWDDLALGDATLAGWCSDRWLGAWRPLGPITDRAAFGSTRGSWHIVAEHVLSPFRFGACSKIGLRSTPGGVGIPFVVADGADTQLRVDAAGLVVDRAGAETRVPLTTLRDASVATGVPVGARTEVYEPGTPAEPDASLPVDPAGAARLADWFGFGASVLEEVRAAAPDRDATRVQLWPEHFDLSVDLGSEAAGQRGTYGASPGDEQHPLPYLYVTHWAAVADDPYWNDTAFGGASLGYEALTATADHRRAALEFLAAGRARLIGR
jgi:hypothetical protein